MTLSNGYFQIIVDTTSPRVTSIRVDVTGQGNYGSNILRNGSGSQSVDCNYALTHYINTSGTLYKSSSSTAHSVTASSGTSITITGIAYGSVVETWTITLNGDTFTWDVSEQWTGSVTVKERRVPVMFFAISNFPDSSGNSSNLVILYPYVKDCYSDNRYGSTVDSRPYANSQLSFLQSNTVGGWYHIPTFSKPGVCGCDFKVTTNKRFKFASLYTYNVNMWTYISQSALDERSTSTSVAKANGNTDSYTWAFQLKPKGAAGGAMDLALPAGEATYQNIIKRHYYDATNCAALFDPFEGMFHGNSPGSYLCVCAFQFETWPALFQSAWKGDFSSEPYSNTDLIKKGLQLILNSYLASNGSITIAYTGNPGAYNHLYDTEVGFILAVFAYYALTGDSQFLLDNKIGIEKVMDYMLTNANANGGFFKCEAPYSIALQQATQGGYAAGSAIWLDWVVCFGWDTYLNSFFYQCLGLMAELEGVMLDSAKQTTYRTAADYVKANFLSKFWRNYSGVYNQSSGLFVSHTDGTNTWAHLYSFHNFMPFYTGAVTDATIASHVVNHVVARESALGMAGYSPLSNYYDAYGATAGHNETWGQYMNGGVFPNHFLYWAATLCKAGQKEAAYTRYKTFLNRVAQDYLIAHSNCTKWDGSFLASWAEEYLSDHYNHTMVVPNVFMGIKPHASYLEIDPYIPNALKGSQVTFLYKGHAVRVKVNDWGATKDIEVESGTAIPVRVYDSGSDMTGQAITFNGVTTSVGANSQVAGAIGQPLRVVGCVL